MVSFTVSIGSEVTRLSLAIAKLVIIVIFLFTIPRHKLSNLVLLRIEMVLVINFEKGTNQKLRLFNRGKTISGDPS